MQHLVTSPVEECPLCYMSCYLVGIITCFFPPQNSFMFCFLHCNGWNVMSEAREYDFHKTYFVSSWVAYIFTKCNQYDYGKQLAGIMISVQNLAHWQMFSSNFFSLESFPHHLHEICRNDVSSCCDLFHVFIFAKEGIGGVEMISYSIVLRRPCRAIRKVGYLDL